MTEEQEWPRIELSDTPRDVVLKMSQGNPGALIVMMKLLELDAHGLVDILRMDDMRMRGPAIWIGYKDHCGEDIQKFRKAIRDRDVMMLDRIAKEGYKVQRSPHSRMDE